MRAKLLLLASLVSSPVVGAATVAHAGARDFVVYAPGMGGTASDAKPYLDAFFAYLEKRLGWPAHGGSGEYLDEPKPLAAYVAGHKPGFGLVSPAYYLELACDKVPVTPLAAVERGGTPTKGRLYVVIKKGAFKSLEDLKGKKLVSNHADDPRYLTNVVFDGKLDVKKDATLESTSSPIKPFKAVSRGEADAAIVDDGQLDKMKTLPFGGELDVLFKSDALPPWPVVAFDKVVKPDERDKLKHALLDMCGDKAGGEACKSMTISRFSDVSASDYASAEARYCKR